MFITQLKIKTMSHPIILEGTDIKNWHEYLSNIIEVMFNPLKKHKLVDDIIRLDKGKYIIKFTCSKKYLRSLWKRIYCDTARFIFSSTIIYNVRIADGSKQYYMNYSPFFLNAPYDIYSDQMPFILYKGYHRGDFTTEYSERCLIDIKIERHIKESEKFIDHTIYISSYQYYQIIDYFNEFK
jgi:hypothetical protein